MSKVVKIVVAKDEKTLIEYTIDNGTIVDVSIVEKETTLEEKVKNLKENNEQVKAISKLIQFDNAGILDKMAKNDSGSVFDTIKDDVVNNPIEASVIKEIDEVSDKINQDKLSQGVKDAANIMKLDEKMDEIARENREKIADNLFSINGNDYYSRDVSKNNLEVPDDLEREEPKDNYEVTRAKNNVIADKIFDSYLSDASKTTERSKRISYLKDMISKINTKDE
jgi:hypothetical protein